MFKTSIFDVINLQELFEKYSNNSINKEYINNVKKSILDFSSAFHLNNFLMSIVDLFLDTIKNIFILIFTYLFYKRIFYEKNKNISNLEENKSIGIEL